MFFKVTKSLIARFIMIVVLMAGPCGDGPVQAQSAVYRAAPDGATSGSCGDDWANPCDLQYLLSVLTSGGEVWVKGGIYKPGNDRNSTFSLRDEVAIYGGFAGTETSRDQRDPDANITVLSGDLNGDDNGNIAYDEPTRAENVFHVVASGGDGNTAILDGFMITGGNANLDSGTHTARGGGMWNGNGSPTLTNITFASNSSLELGGGMFNEDSSQPILTNVTFSNNSSEGGGGMANARSNPVLSDVLFIGNLASYSGGGMLNVLGSSPSLENTTFQGNSAHSFGGGMSNYESTPSVSSSTFFYNAAFGNDHPIHSHDQTPPFGGGMYNWNSDALVLNSTFSNNRAGNESNPIGGSSIGNQESDPTLTHITILEGLDGIMNDASHPVVRNSIIWKGIPTGDFIAITDVNNSSSIVSDSVIESGFPGATNIITVDPMLGVLGDYRGSTQIIPLSSGSSAIDAANASYCPATDQRGLARPQGAGCDIGAFEFVEYTISGNTDFGGVTLYYTGGMTTSDDNGNYTFAVPYRWTGTVTPYRAGYRFTPDSRNYSNVQSDQLNQDFTAERVFTISGNAGVGGAMLGYEDDGTIKTVTALSNGNYSLQVPEEWTGSITPSKANVTFSPASRSYIGVQSDKSGENYTAVITVINQNNAGIGSLRQAITDAISGATINFAPTLAGQTIFLGSTLDVNKDLMIDGSELDPRVTISGNDTARIFTIGSISSARTVTLQSLILKDGQVTGAECGGAILINSGSKVTLSFLVLRGNDARYGGAICGGGAKLTILESEFISNTAEYTGGAFYGAPLDFKVIQTKFVGNSAASGGAIYLNGSGQAVFEDNVFENNTASSGGGAITSHNSPGVSLTLRTNLFSGNFAGSAGGAIRIDRLSSKFAVLENNTLYGNQANFGGAISTDTSIELRNNTFSSNQANNVSASINFTGNAMLSKLYNNIFANSMGGAECNPLSYSGSVIGGNNLVEDGSGVCGALPGTIISDPMLGSFADNGGSTQTMALLTGSPAMDAGDDMNCPTTDQRGVARPQGSHCDIGAFEYMVPSMPTPTVLSVLRANSSSSNASSVDFTITFSEPVTGVDATDFTLSTVGVIGATITNVSGTGAIRTVTVSTGSGNGTIRLHVVDDNTIIDAASNPLGGVIAGDGDFTSGEIYTITKNPIFGDVPTDHWAWSFIERLYDAGITGGCSLSPLQYCPETTVTRSQMAVFLERGIHGSSYSPPTVGASTGFGDVAPDYWSAAWIKQLAAEGITAGCGSGNYCPEYPVTRDQMAVFLLRSKYGSSYSPPAVGTSTGFGDVPTDHWAAPWIKQLVTEGITAGCGNGNYCPQLSVTRAQMAVFLVKTFSLP